GPGPAAAFGRAPGLPGRHVPLRHKVFDRSPARRPERVAAAGAAGRPRLVRAGGGGPEGRPAAS
ncbi:hypothetical protein, partial [Streptomyces showdoensis]|uniref:hypothetical protein n=1 Tax=Streptomyces showdoensis TaxID=68268 RepID=UPI001969BE2E